MSDCGARNPSFGDSTYCRGGDCVVDLRGWFVRAVGLLALAFPGEVSAAAPPQQPVAVIASMDPDTSEVVLANDRIRMRFHAGQPKFGLFPNGYVGYSLDLKAGDNWTTMGTAPYFTSIMIRTKWGRDMLHYVIPEQVSIQNEAHGTSVTFTSDLTDLDRTDWHFRFTFALDPDKQFVDCDFSARVSEPRGVLLFWGPKLHVGGGGFGAAKDEALFPGVEYLGPEGQSSANPTMAPDFKQQVAPLPEKITIPLMTVLKDGHAAGIMWDPMQRWNGRDTCPSAVFSSPNALERGDNHLLGLFAPSVPRYVAENGLRAHTPATITPEDTLSIHARLFAIPAEHATDAVDLYIKAQGGLPQAARGPLEPDAALEMLVRAMCTTARDPGGKGWPGTFGQAPELAPACVEVLMETAPLLKDAQLAATARKVAREAMDAGAGRTMQMALRLGGVEQILRADADSATTRVARQQPDGSWVYVPGKRGEEVLSFWKGPPEPGYIGRAGERNAGITAGEVAQLLGHALVTADTAALEAAMKGLRDLDQYALPVGHYFDSGEECPHSPSLHASYLAMRSYLLAYRIGGDKKHLEQAVEWAKTGLPFLYLWSLPAREPPSAYIHPWQYLRADEVYTNPVRDPMLYASLYGYGTSHYTHPWLRLPVQWIGLVYAEDLVDLRRLDQTHDWGRAAEGIVTSCLWQCFDKGPYAGFYPDGFSLETWVPSGPAIGPRSLLHSLAVCHYGVTLKPATEIVRGDGWRYHVTSAATIGDASQSSGGKGVRFTLNSPGWPGSRAIVAGFAGAVSLTAGLVKDKITVTADGTPLEFSADLEALEECWSQGPAGVVLVKVSQKSAPRLVEVNGK
jgi:hypothetical protein